MIGIVYGLSRIPPGTTLPTHPTTKSDGSPISTTMYSIKNKPFYLYLYKSPSQIFHIFSEIKTSIYQLYIYYYYYSYAHTFLLYIFNFYFIYVIDEVL